MRGDLLNEKHRTGGKEYVMAISLFSLLPIAKPEDYKVHLAGWNGEEQPLDVFVQDRKSWDGWNSWRLNKDDFNRTYILSLIDFYPETGVWLFGGIYEVLSRDPVDKSHSYGIEGVPGYKDLVGRLKIRFQRPGRARSIKLENCYAEMTVSELLKEVYSGEPSPATRTSAMIFVPWRRSSEFSDRIGGQR